MAKFLTEEQRQEIKAMAAAGKSRPEIAKAMGVSGFTVTKYAPNVRRLRAPTRGTAAAAQSAQPLAARARVSQNGNREGVRTTVATIVPTGHKTYLIVLPGWGVLLGRRATLKV